MKPPTEIRLRIEAHLENALVQRELIQLFQNIRAMIVYICS